MLGMPQFVKSLGMVSVSVPVLGFFPILMSYTGFQRASRFCLLTALPLFLASPILKKKILKIGMKILLSFVSCYS